MRVLKIDAPSPRQREFLTACTRYVGYGGAKGGGKSWSVMTKAKLLALHYKGIKTLIVRRTFAELDENHITPLYKDLYGIAKYNDSKKIMKFPNGSTIKFDYGASARDGGHFQGREYDVIFIDEATLIPEELFDTIDSCVRGANDFPKRTYVTCNPGGVGHEYVKRLFIDRDYRRSERAENYTFIKALVTDNRALMLKQPDYIERLENLPPMLREAYLNGNWDVFVGQYFSEFKRELTIVRPYELPAGWTRFRSLDYGMDCTCCLWWAVDAQGRCVIYRELWEPGLILSDAARKIAAMTPDAEKIKYTVASPDLWNRRQDSGVSGFETMTAAGLRGLIRANDARVPGWRAVREYLTPVRDEYGGTISRLRIFDTCIHACRDLPKLQYDPIEIEDAADEPHEITHAPEAIRYGVMSRPKGERMEAPEHYNFDAERRAAEAKKTASGYAAPGKSFLDY